MVCQQKNCQVKKYLLDSLLLKPYCMGSYLTSYPPKPIYKVFLSFFSFVKGLHIKPDRVFLPFFFVWLFLFYFNSSNWLFRSSNCSCRYSNSVSWNFSAIFATACLISAILSESFSHPRFDNSRTIVAG